jgi:hypothetical protein
MLVVYKDTSRIWCFGRKLNLLNGSTRTEQFLIYPNELEVNDTNDTPNCASYFDVHYSEPASRCPYSVMLGV